MDQNEGDDALVDSIKAKLDSLSSLTTHCCIYKVPNKLRRLNNDAYTPRLVSFGPLHRGKEELQAMEEHKYSIDDEKFISEPEHFVDLLRSCYLPLVPIRLEETTLTLHNAPPTTELHTAGVSFKPAETSSCLLDIHFADGVLKIPTIVIDDITESLYRNIIVFEQCHCSDKSFLHYTTLLGCFIKATTDADLLIRSGIIMNHLGNSEDVSKLFNSISKEVTYDRRFYFSTLSENLQAYCNTPWNRWKAVLRREYFQNPWSVASVLAALLLLLLTFIQAVCSILAV